MTPTEVVSVATSVKSSERLLTLREIREMGKASRATVYRWTHDYGLKTVRVGAVVRVRESDWLAWLAKHTEPKELNND